MHFITGNKGKFEEVAAVLPGLVQLDIDLPEIQTIDPREVIRAKLDAALHHTSGEFLVEDTSFTLDCLNGLPGPLIKWFLKTIGNSGLFEIARRFEIFGAEAKVIIGYARNHEEIYFFEGTLRGTIVSPRGEGGIGWDPIFKPEGYARTFAEMAQEEKNQISMRRIAVDQLKVFLEEQK